MLNAIVSTVGAMLILTTLAPLSGSQKWWIRIWDFPRLQIAGALALVLIAFPFSHDLSSHYDLVFLAALMGSLIYQAFSILPYTPLWGCIKKVGIA